MPTIRLREVLHDSLSLRLEKHHDSRLTGAERKHLTESEKFLDLESIYDHVVVSSRFHFDRIHDSVLRRYDVGKRLMSST